MNTEPARLISEDSTLPAPLIGPEVDLSGLPGFIIHTGRLFSSELIALATPEECWCAFRLWCMAWQQTPPASLPDDERILAAFSGAGAKWKKVRDMALRGFVKCSDGRLYHHVVAEIALEAWEKRKKYRASSKRGNEKRWTGGKASSEKEGDRKKAFPIDAEKSAVWDPNATRDVIPTGSRRDSQRDPNATAETLPTRCQSESPDDPNAMCDAIPSGSQHDSQRDPNATLDAIPLGSQRDSQGDPREVEENGSRRRSEENRSTTKTKSNHQNKNIPPPQGGTAANAALQPEIFASASREMTAKEAIFGLAVPWLVEQGLPEKQARSLLGAAAKQLGDEGAWQLVQRGMQENPLEPAAWLCAAMQNRTKTHAALGRRSKPTALEAHNAEAAATWLASMQSSEEEGDAPT